MNRALWLIVLPSVALLLAAAGSFVTSFQADLPILLAAGFLPFITGLSFAQKKNGEDEEDDERSRTIVAMPAWMSEELQKEREKLAQDTTRTLAFDPSEAIKAAREAAASGKSAAGSTARDTSDQGTGTSRTLMFDPKAASSAREEATDVGNDRTASYSPEELKRIRESLRDTRAEDEGNARTVAYMPAVTEQQVPSAPKKEEGDAFAATVAYMPAVTATENGTLAYGPGEKEKLLQAMGRKPVEAEDTDDGSAATQVYSKEQAQAVKDAYSLLDGSRKPQAASTPAASAKGTATSAAQAAAPQAAASKPAAAAAPASQPVAPVRQPAPTGTGATASSTTSPGVFSSAPVSTPSSIPASTSPAGGSTAPASTPVSAGPATEDRRSSPKVSAMPVEGQKSGMSTGSLIALLVVLLALAGGATAVILHLLGIVTLPLPQLDLFSK